MLQARLPTAPHYRDRKRYAWLLSLVVPCTVGVGPALMWWTSEAARLYIDPRQRAKIVRKYGLQELRQSGC